MIKHAYLKIIFDEEENKEIFWCDHVEKAANEIVPGAQVFNVTDRTREMIRLVDDLNNCARVIKS